MEFAAYIAMTVVSICFLALMFTRFAPDIILMGGVTTLLVLGVLNLQEALSGFSNEGMITVALLFIGSRLITNWGAAWLAGSLLGHPSRIGLAQLRLMLPVAALSSVVNNTPVVAMMIPAVLDWAKRHKFAVSQLMMPLSYAAIIGGACTLIGTSTNLVVYGMLREYYQASGDHQLYQLGIFDLAWVGVPCVFVVFVYVYFFSPLLLPKGHREKKQQFGDTRQYTVEMLVELDSPLIGKTVEQAGLRSLPGVFLIEIQRSGHLITAVGPAQRLYEDDRLIFAGNVESVVDLQKMRGLRPADDQIFKLDTERSQRHLVEESNSFPQVGKTVKKGVFAQRMARLLLLSRGKGSELKAVLATLLSSLAILY